MRRLLRWAFSGFCLLSLLACLGTGWLRWRCRASFYEVDGSPGRGLFVRLDSDGDGLSGLAAAGWPGSARVRGGSAPFDRSRFAPGPLVNMRTIDGYFTRPRLGISGCRGVARTGLDADGSVHDAAGGETVVRCDRPSRDFPCCSATAPHAVVAGASALPPLLWLALRSRRTLVLRRRRRLGLCRRCGYDLTGNESGTCPECGTETPAAKAVT